MEEDESTFAAEESEHASLSDLIEQHFYSAIELRSAGYDLDSLKDRFDVYDLKHAGYTASELREVGKPLNELKGEFNVDELREAGFSALDLKSVGSVLISSETRMTYLNSVMQAMPWRLMSIFPS